MNTKTNHQTIEGWLFLATRCLPAHLKPVIAQELHTHCQDSVSSFLNKGYDLEKANLNAMLLSG